jgi:hypothetical protein
MKSISLRVQRIVDFGALVSVTGVDNDSGVPMTVHIDYQRCTAFWRAWRATDCAQPVEYAADRLVLQLDMVPNEHLDDASEAEIDSSQAVSANENQTSAPEVEP